MTSNDLAKVTDIRALHIIRDATDSEDLVKQAVEEKFVKARQQSVLDVFWLGCTDDRRITHLGTFKPWRRQTKTRGGVS